MSSQHVSVRALRGFVVDLLLAAAAGALRWHPVYDFFEAHPALVYWGVGLVLVLLSLVLSTAFLAVQLVVA